jgi:hypothetical protein
MALEQGPYFPPEPPSRTFHLWIDFTAGFGSYPGSLLITQGQPAQLTVSDDFYTLTAHGLVKGKMFTERVSLNRWSGEFEENALTDPQAWEPPTHTLLNQEKGTCQAVARRLF